MQKPMKKILSVAVTALLANSAAHAAGFSLYTESNGSAVGNFAAGIAAEAADASTGWYNPAGLALIHDQQAVFSGIGIFLRTGLDGTSTFRTTNLPSYVQQFHDLDGGQSAFVPSFHYAKPLGENASYGLSVTAPFGLATLWSRFDPLRYAATFSELLTTNISPEIGGKITEHLALGVGVDLQYARVKFNTILGAPALAQFLGANPMVFDSYSYNKGDSFAPGFHAGALVMLNDNHTRIGFNYQSQVHHRFHGWSRLTGRLASPGLMNHNSIYWSNDLFSNEIEFPEIATLSVYQDVNDKFALLGSVVYTGWHVFRSIQLNNIAAFVTGLNQVKVNSTSTENFEDTWRFALGANYRFNEQWMLRFGGGFDESPTQDAFRTVRLPDADRWALSIGGHYQWRPNIGVDFGYTHLWANSVTINKTISAGAGSTFNVNARGDAQADLVGGQVVWIMDQPLPAGK